MYEQVYSPRTSRPNGRGNVATAQDLPPHLILILSLSLQDYYPETASSQGQWPHTMWASMRWGACNHLTLLSWRCLAERWNVQRSSSVADHFEVTGPFWRGERRRGDPGPPVFLLILLQSQSPCLTPLPESAWCPLALPCPMPALGCSGSRLGSLDVETSRSRPRAQHSSHFHLSSLAGRCHKNQILREDF